MTTPRYVVEDTRPLCTAEELASDVHQFASLPFGVWDRIEARYVSRHPDHAAAVAALRTLEQSR